MVYDMMKTIMHLEEIYFIKIEMKMIMNLEMKMIMVKTKIFKI